jgi:hypothetical protein
VGFVILIFRKFSFVPKPPYLLPYYLLSPKAFVDLFEPEWFLRATRVHQQHSNNPHAEHFNLHSSTHRKN